MLVPTVVMVHDLPSADDQSWYRGKLYVYIKITLTEPSSAIQNSVEIERAVIKVRHQRKHPSDHNYLHRRRSKALHKFPISENRNYIASKIT